MRTVTVRSVLNGIAVRMGMDVTKTIPAHTVAAYLGYLNERLREVWEQYPFPEWTRIEQRQYRPDYSAATTYAAGAEVFYAGDYYSALVTTTGNLPTDTDFWEVAEGMLRNIALDQDGETEIGEVLAVYDADPRVYRSRSEYPFSILEVGLLVPRGPAQPWVEFTLRPPVFTSADLDSDAFPYVIADVVKYLAAANALQEDGHFDKAGQMEAAGLIKLDKELDKIELKQGQQKRWGAIVR